MAIYLTELDPSNLSFPSPFDALDDPNGLLAFGGDLSADRLLTAYHNGIFPWYGPDEPILWWSPSPRAVFDPSVFKPSKSLKKFQRKHQYRVSINHATEQVIDQCAALRSAEETWLNQDMRHAYKQLAQQGHCHSVEVWQEERLIGGLYGLSIGQLFCGESMFSLESNASKVALWYFCSHFQQQGGQLIDCQVLNEHTQSLGAFELPRESFIQSLLSLRYQVIDELCFQPQWLNLPAEK
ncbi:leucyl/phenylalanyl-tRNA--protein transferase [Vibrio ichthyoenteri ATCC 700023]|uniref:Leucyl/phenylalanyl-tRNA--protein transferase n=1 Tax=Vibrio ichthyoenteri ATCC 700023 TaxID=870968 RepID=F9S397_9VIBR|nr:leucyl/phenylalanyl-tRNA--protein transferase [Vibrio ichthyoenteri]EGU38121.1 leucyl/phenylalanyl-tRNA--protein transferase [Vibrio ichthyoenteri ATCC 700023]